MVQTIVLALHVLVCLLIIGLVLLQRGKGADAGTGFGAGASGTVFGARGSANFLSRTTAVLAASFFVTSLALAFFANDQQAPSSLLERAAPAETPSALPPERDLDLPPELPVETPPAEAPGAESAAPESAGDSQPTAPADEQAPESGAGND